MTDFGQDAFQPSGAEGDQRIQGDLLVQGRIQAEQGIQSNGVKVTATADGLTTGLIPEGASFIHVTSADANHIITLPTITDDVVGHTVRGWISATGCEIRTPASSAQEINSEDCDGTKEAAIPATTLFELTCVDETIGWILRAWDELGAVITAIVPD